VDGDGLDARPERAADAWALDGSGVNSAAGLNKKRAKSEIRGGELAPG
jgi:hypothetical protein